MKRVWLATLPQQSDARPATTGGYSDSPNGRQSSRSSDTSDRCRSHADNPVSCRAAAIAAASGECHSPDRRPLNCTAQRRWTRSSRRIPADVGYSYAIAPLSPYPDLPQSCRQTADRSRPSAAHRRSTTGELSAASCQGCWRSVLRQAVGCPSAGVCAPVHKSPCSARRRRCFPWQPGAPDLQCELSSGTVMCCSNPRLTPPNTSSRARECP